MILENPDIENAYNLIQKALINRMMILLTGSCEVNYSGRGESLLSDGDRIVMIKRDKTLLIHRNKNFKPVNWNPSDIIECRITNEGLQILSKRVVPEEIVSIVFHNIYFIAALYLKDSEKPLLTDSKHSIGHMQASLKDFHRKSDF